MAKKITFKNSLFCEDARLDANGKPIIVGVMPEYIHVLNLPIKLDKMFLFTEASTHGEKADPLTFSVKNSDGTVLAQVITAISVANWSFPFPLIVKFNPIELENEGKYTICFEDRILREINVIKLNKNSDENSILLSEKKMQELLKEATESLKQLKEQVQKNTQASNKSE